MSSRYVFTSESVTEGHPDKLCDQISDGVLDAIFAKDPLAKVACETFATTGLVLVGGEIKTSEYVDLQDLVRSIVRDIGYTKGSYGLDAETCSVLSAIHEQSEHIRQGVDKSTPELTGAGDQGLMFGYATKETPELMPLAIQLAHRLARRLAQVRKQHIIPHLRPDGKTQVTIEWQGGKPVHAHALVIAAQHDPDVNQDDLRRRIIAYVIEPVVEEYVKSGHVPADFFDTKTELYINHTGKFEIGGPHGDTGLTGRKIIVDTYGGAAPHGGGAFSGKDPTKVDRSAAYGARWAAKNIVAAGLAERCQIQLAYSIGHHQPLSVNVQTFGTGAEKGGSRISDTDLEAYIKKVFDFSPFGLIRELQLRRPIYRQVAAYGHFGRDDLDLPWERLDRVEELRRIAGL
ncbi:MAG TPA: methionine adenosyltransferase [Candidatus Thermoplasmatota archaeon]|nr:methionine adenosyltransferase [Candidatus Thermoplasmatota archaeon]